jgi:LmbE family N-acetylglucosaminyl deacetylase
MRRNLSFFRAFALISFLLFTGDLSSQPKGIMNTAELKSALKKLNVLGTVLYIAAHPDDENTAVLSYYASEKLLRAGYLAVTRGDGGQNLIGKEQAELLGVIRTQELLEARKIDGAEQFFTRAIDFGYTKSPEETFQIWGKDNILSDVVWVIRNFRPDVIITRFPTTGEGGHGQHTASAVLAVDAFNISADPSKYPEQLKSVEPWKVKRVFWNKWIRDDKADLSGLLKIDIGAYNPLLGKSYTEIAAESRSMHKSQGFGATGRRGETLNYFELLKGDPANSDILDGINLTWDRVPGSEKVKNLLKEAEQNFNPEEPALILPSLLEAYKEMSKLNENYWVPIKKKELLEVIRSISGMWIEAISSDYYSSPGETIKISAGIVNRSDYPFTLKKISVPSFHTDYKSAEKIMQKGEFISEELNVTLDKEAGFTHPYWLKEEPGKGIYTVDDAKQIGKPENEPPLNAEFTVLADNTELTFTTPVFYRWNDPVKGEQYRPFGITPEVTVQFENGTFLFPDNEPKEINVIVSSHTDKFSGKLHLNLPENWKAEPEEIPISFSKKGEEQSFRFSVSPPFEESKVQLFAEVQSGEKIFTRGMVSIDYPHIPLQTLFPKAKIKLVRLNLAKTISSIGYVEGSGDDIPVYLQHLGYKVTMLSDNDMDSDLSSYDAIITGIRAYNTRHQLEFKNKNLLNYVENGGTLIVQYNTNGELATDKIGPYPFKISRDRITNEDAPVNILKPGHSLLNYPNKITAQDFENWIQERGLYFPGEWDNKYETVISSNDPGESPKEGGILFTRYGKGVFIYTGYSWFRQLPAGVPGAYRIFINLISAGKQSG